MIPYVQSVKLCRAEVIAGIGLDEDDLTPLVMAAKLALGQLERPTPELAAVLRSARDTDDLDELRAIAADWRTRFARVVVLGIGGSSLGAATLTALRDDSDEGPEVVIADQLDAHAVARLLRPDGLAETGFLVISKSGATAETLAQALLAVERVGALLDDAGELAKRFLFLSAPGDNPLRRLAAEIDARVLDHEPHLDGRFSVLSAVGLLPAALAGLDVAAVRAGAAAVLDQALSSDDPLQVPPALGAMVQVALKREREVSQSVLMPYSGQLQTFAYWYRQLWAESLGKNGRGTTPVNAMGPVDQHSQLQLYLDGPIDKFFTVIALDHDGRGPAMNGRLARAIGLDYLAGRAVGDLAGAMQRATIESLAERGRPVRTISLRQLDEATIGALCMHFMLETVIAAALWGVNPFGQPAVEEGKQRARRYLEGGRE